MILPLSEANVKEAGGKARGLAILLGMDLNVPDGIVLIPDESEDWHSELEEYLGSHVFTEVAVRSSGLFEDGENISFAGQFESFLNCRRKEEILAAVEKCHRSAYLERAGSYREHFHLQNAKVFPVVIQRMVRASRSGVIFTADPVNNRTDRWMISVIRGTGEHLMDGSHEGEQIVLSRNGRILQKGKLLSEDEIGQLFHVARMVTEQTGHPMDLEWAFDDKGVLYWLQARPVTTLKKVHLNELDSTLFCENEVFTRCNIGEMMPGPVTPLTYSVFGRAIEVGLQDFYQSCGVQKSISEEWIYIRMYYYHLFFSMTRLADISDAVLFNKQEDVEFAIMGDTLGSAYGDYRTARPRSFSVKLRNQFRQLRYLSGGAHKMKKLGRLAETFMPETSNDLLEQYQKLDKSLEVLNQAYAHHYCTSSQSGTYQSALMAFLRGGKGAPTSAHYHAAASLMSDLREVESADVVKSIDRIYEGFGDSAEIKDWLESGTAGENSEILRAFHQELHSLLLRHGHRCIREAELREKSWAEEPEQLISLIRKRFQTGERKAPRRESYEESKRRIYSEMGWIKKIFLTVLLKWARTAVARREFTKSMAVKIQQKIKQGYLSLAGMMVDLALLNDTDQVFFLTHEELGRCLKEKSHKWKAVAEERRRIFPEYFKLKFPDTCQGYPEPLPADHPGIKINGNAVKGLTVSSGSVQARVRIVEKLEDARYLEKGEIMVCRCTDVGWTPYFSLAGGLITEIGSPLSHGAVVAREYGIPAIVNAKGAMDFFKTGETVLLEGASGIIHRME
jgi:phosphohistidine swiveling domain-containing protein